MEFKIDTKPTYDILTPVTDTLDANLTDNLRQKREILAKDGRINTIIDLQNCTSADKASLPALAALHEEVYTNAGSMVLTGICDDVMTVFKENKLNEILNIAPTMIEAIDIISMEILERDLLGED